MTRRHSPHYKKKTPVPGDWRSAIPLRLSDGLRAQNLLSLFRVLLLFPRRRRQSDLKNFVDRLHVVNCQMFQLFWREILIDIHLVLSWQQDVANARAFRRKDFLLDSRSEERRVGKECRD